ncbi:unnamed protein product [Closterium sp. NIES-54]
MFSLSGYGTGDWLTAIPIEATRRIGPVHFANAVRFRLGLPFSTPKNCDCAERTAIADPRLPNHLLRCGTGKHRINTRNELRDACISMVQHAGFIVYSESAVFCPIEEQTADLTMTDRRSGAVYVCDVTVTDPISTRDREAEKGRGWAAREQADKKIKHCANRPETVGFFPLAVDTYGCPCAEVPVFLKLLADTAARWHFNADSKSFYAAKFLHHFRQRWSAALQRAQSVGLLLKLGEAAAAENPPVGGIGQELHPGDCFAVILRASAASSPGRLRQAVPQQQRHPPRAQLARATTAPRAGPPRLSTSHAGGHGRSQEGSQGETSGPAPKSAAERGDCQRGGVALRESPREHGSAEAKVLPPGTGGAHQHQQGERTEPPTSRHLRPQIPLPQQAEPVADGDEIWEQAPIQREKELAAPGSGGEAQQQAAGWGGAQPDGEPRGLARRAANCSGSAPPSPPEPPSTLPAKDPPSSQAGDTPHPRHEHGNPSNPLDPRGEQASTTVAGTAVETHAGDEMICGPGGERGNGAATSDGQATEGVTVGLQEPPPSKQEQTDPPPQAQPTEPVRQWWRTPPLVTKQRPAQAGRGQKRSAQHGRQGQMQGVQQHPQQGQTPTACQGEPGSLVTQAEQPEQQRERSGQPLPRQGEPRVLQRFGFTYSSPQATPLSTRHSLSALPSDESVEPSGPYPELFGCLMYLMTCTRPDLAYPLSILARYVAPGRHRPEHMTAAKRVLRYLCSTSGMGLVLGGQSPVVLTGHADASWADDQTTQRSSQGYTFSLGSGSVSWRATRSSSVLGSSCEAEIDAGAMAAQELCWLTYLLTDLGEPPRSPPVLYVDNKAMLALC